jgi:hypothetical protein
VGWVASSGSARSRSGPGWTARLPAVTSTLRSPWAWSVDGGLGQLTDELIGQVINAVRPERAQGHGPAWDRLLAVEEGL